MSEFITKYLLISNNTLVSLLSSIPIQPYHCFQYVCKIDFAHCRAIEAGSLYEEDKSPQADSPRTFVHTRPKQRHHSRRIHRGLSQEQLSRRDCLVTHILAIREILYMLKLRPNDSTTSPKCLLQQMRP